MSFLELCIKDLYVTDTSDIPEDFYGVVLPETILYKRAAGFFSSSALVTLGLGLKQFYYNGGKMQLLVSPNFSQEDYEAIELGYKAQEDLATQKIVEMFDIDHIEYNDGTNILAWLIYENRLEIRVVIKTRKDRKAIFHDKFSVLVDEEENRITFRGSMNESETAMVDNYESIEVDCFWEPMGYRRAFQRENQFDEIWCGKSLNWSTIPVPQAVKEALIKIRKPIDFDNEMESDLIENESYMAGDDNPRIPECLRLRKYQKLAIAEWIRHSNKGIFEMATGTGKTKTALSAITKILTVYYQNNMKCGLIITVPFVVLLEQWLEDLNEFNIHPIACYESKSKWEHNVIKSIQLFNNNTLDRFFFITTNKTFISGVFQNCINQIDGDYIFCADEMHHLTSDLMQEALPLNATYRLGLSATLMSKYNSKRMEFVKSYFGGIIFKYSMKEAIDSGYLTRYFYHPIYVSLTDKEKFEYFELSRKISRCVAANGGEFDEDEACVKALLSQRARILASAENKLQELKKLASNFVDSSNLIVYCGDKIEIDTQIRYIDKVYDIISNEIGIISTKFTATENRKQRKEILELFKQKVVQALIAIRCLDEGVDIPQLETAIIMSSGSNPKEFIQRRGRILRKSQGKEYAYIYDFIVIPTLSAKEINQLSLDIKKMELKIIAGEFERVQEFADLAENGFEVKSEFLEKWSIYAGGMNNAQ
ncbi:MAG: DEAD/DEAH box helicase family protein [Ruminococcus flavefaciens]|nr:DEAD/DEAH box helicase family protein [Ruminococcus flavefaciens]